MLPPCCSSQAALPAAGQVSVGTRPGRQQEEKFYIPRARSSELNHSHCVNKPPAGQPINAASGKLPGALAQNTFHPKTRGHGKRKKKRKPLPEKRTWIGLYMDSDRPKGLFSLCETPAQPVFPHGSWDTSAAEAGEGERPCTAQPARKPRDVSRPRLQQEPTGTLPASQGLRRHSPRCFLTLVARRWHRLGAVPQAAAREDSGSPKAPAGIQHGRSRLAAPRCAPVSGLREAERARAGCWPCGRVLTLRQGAPREPLSSCLTSQEFRVCGRRTLLGFAKESAHLNKAVPPNP